MFFRFDSNIFPAKAHGFWDIWVKLYICTFEPPSLTGQIRIFGMLSRMVFTTNVQQSGTTRSISVYFSLLTGL